MSQSAEKFLSTNTLAFVVSLAVGKVTTVELRNESYVTGRVVEADGFMNVTMREAVFVDPTGRSKKFESFFVPCRLIRYVQIPTEIDIKAAIKKRFDPEATNLKSNPRREIALSGGRKKILALKEKRRQEDIAAALAMKQSMSQTEKKS